MRWSGGRFWRPVLIFLLVVVQEAGGAEAYAGPARTPGNNIINFGHFRGSEAEVFLLLSALSVPVTADGDRARTLMFTNSWWPGYG